MVWGTFYTKGSTICPRTEYLEGHPSLWQDVPGDVVWLGGGAFQTTQANLLGLYC